MIVSLNILESYVTKTLRDSKVIVVSSVTLVTDNVFLYGCAMLPTLWDRTESVVIRCNLWNKLPANIRNASSLGNFKSLLKTHLFKVVFTDK